MESQTQNKTKDSILNPWLWKMAWRDSRTHRRRLFLFMSSIVLGIAALTAIRSFGDSLESAIDDQAKSLLGADLMIRSRQVFSPETEALIDSIGGEQARQVSFGSMAFFPKGNDTRLVSIRAIEGGYPFYGEFETTPPSAAQAFKTTPNGALVDQGLMIQYDLQVGDSVKVGANLFRILGQLNQAPGQAAAGALISPRIYISMADLEKTQLIRFGSRVNYRVYFQLDASTNAEELVEEIEPFLDKNRLSARSAEGNRQNLGEALNNLYRFLNLTAFIALILGSIGVASAVHVYIKQKLTTVAMLRCVGAQMKQTFYIYLIQTGLMGLIGALVGAALGVLIQTILPEVLQDFLPVAVDFKVSWPAVIIGLVAGLGIALLFAMLPLLNIRKISPLLAIRASFDESAHNRDRLRWVLYSVILLAVTGFAISQTKRWFEGVYFTTGLLAAFGLLAGFAKLIMVAVKNFFPSSWSYIWRQSLANLYRPNNQTLILMLAIGLGTFLITTLYFSKDSLLGQISSVGSGDQPNLVFFDVQSDQVEGVETVIQSNQMPVIYNVPIVTVRIKEVKGQPVEEIYHDSTDTRPEWAFKREYRSTYRDSLFETETIVSGKWQENAAESDSIFISVEEGIARNLEVEVGDEIVVDVQGIPITTYLGSTRKVDWQRVQPNFFIVFPEGVLEDAPQIYVLVTRAASVEASVNLQRAIVQQFPNVSAIDLALILSTVNSILDKIGFVIRFMALFSILTGLTVLAAAVITTRFQRIQESVLLRTLGAKEKQVSRIMALEYFYLGALAGLTGILLALAAGWALAEFAFQITFVPSLVPIVVIWCSVIGLTILLGMINSRGIANRPPLEILRAEA